MDHIKNMLETWAIRPFQSPWISPVVLVRKKDGKLSFCTDLNKINARTNKIVIVCLTLRIPETI